MSKRNKLHKLPYDKRQSYLREKEIKDKNFKEVIKVFEKELPGLNEGLKKIAEDNDKFWQDKIHFKGD